jgi:hypothetical protein
MNRREFLKVGAAAIAAASLPKIASTAGAVEEWEAAAPRMGRIDDVRFVDNVFNPEMEYGNILPLTYDPPPETHPARISAQGRDRATGPDRLRAHGWDRMAVSAMSEEVIYGRPGDYADDHCLTCGREFRRKIPHTGAMLRRDAETRRGL